PLTASSHSLTYRHSSATSTPPSRSFNSWAPSCSLALLGSARSTTTDACNLLMIFLLPASREANPSRPSSATIGTAQAPSADLAESRRSLLFDRWDRSPPRSPGRWRLKGPSFRCTSVGGLPTAVGERVRNFYSRCRSSRFVSFRE